MSESTHAPLVDVRNLKVQFRSEQGLLRAVDGVSFSIDANQVVGVVGESGSGKSVMLLSILGLLNDPNLVIEGSVRYKGQELLGLSNRQLRAIRGNEIAMIFQDPMTALTPVYSVGWQIAEQLRAHKRISARSARRRTIELLHEVGIPSPETVAKRYPHQLSGGMRQRVVIAMALSCEPSLLLADEPTTALDVSIQAQILDLLRSLRRNHASSIVIVTHDLGVAAQFAESLFVMYAGTVVERGSTRTLLTSPKHPYTQGLLASIPPLDGQIHQRLDSIPGNPPLITDLPTGCLFAPRCKFCFEACARKRPSLIDDGDHSVACYLSNLD